MKLQLMFDQPSTRFDESLPIRKIGYSTGYSKNAPFIKIIGEQVPLMRPKRNSPTIMDVANKAFVSKATVSHVLNGTRFVELETKLRVEQAIADLGYRPNAVARSLTTNRTGTIGIIVSDASNYFFGELLRGAEDFLRPANYAAIICNTDEILEHEEHYLNLLLKQRVDGIVAAATSQKWSILQEAEHRHVPIVFVDRRFEGLHGPFVGADNISGRRMAV